MLTVQWFTQVPRQIRRTCPTRHICAMIRALYAALRRRTCTPSLPLPAAVSALDRQASRYRGTASGSGGDGAMHGEEGVVPAKFVGICQETPTIKRFVLQPHPPSGTASERFSFLPGQWCDFFIPGLPNIGGFSFISTPRQLERQGTFELAVKRSSHPPAAWLHNKARVGDRVAVRVGGSFHYHPGDERRPLLFVAGGVGINPLLSILTHCCEMLKEDQPGHRNGSMPGGSSSGTNGGNSTGGNSWAALRPPLLPAATSAPAALQVPAAEGGGEAVPLAAEEAGQRCRGPAGEDAVDLPAGMPRGLPHAVVLFSASVPAELAFRRELEGLQATAGGGINLQVHVTAAEWRGREAEWGGRWGRIGRADLQAALQWLEEAGGDTGAGACCTAPAAPHAAAAAAADDQQCRPLAAQQGPHAALAASNSGSIIGHGSVRGMQRGRSQVVALVCGPSAMEDAVIENLLSLGLSREQIRFEKWW